MRTLTLATILSLAAPAANAGDFGFSILLGSRGHGHRHERRDECHRVYVPGRYETVEREVCVPGYWTVRHVSPRWEWRFDSCGHRTRVMVRAACTERVWVPPHREMRCERVYVPGFWRYDCHDSCHRH
jgi:hypothetical protein